MGTFEQYCLCSKIYRIRDRRQLHRSYKERYVQCQAAHRSCRPLCWRRVEYARRVQGDLDWEGRLQLFQRLLRPLGLDSSSLPVVSDKSTHIVLKDVLVSSYSFTKTNIRVRIC